MDKGNVEFPSLSVQVSVSGSKYSNFAVFVFKHQISLPTRKEWCLEYPSGHGLTYCVITCVVEVLPL